VLCEYLLNHTFPANHLISCTYLFYYVYNQLLGTLLAFVCAKHLKTFIWHDGCKRFLKQNFDKRNWKWDQSIIYSIATGATSSIVITLFKFKLIYLRSIAKQVIPTYINHSRPLIPDGFHRSLFFERGLRGERSQTCPYMLSAEQRSIWYHFYNVFGMTRSGIEPMTSRSRGEH